MQGISEERENVVFLSRPFFIWVICVDGYYLQKMLNFSSVILPVSSSDLHCIF